MQPLFDTNRHPPDSWWLRTHDDSFGRLWQRQSGLPAAGNRPAGAPPRGARSRILRRDRTPRPPNPRPLPPRTLAPEPGAEHAGTASTITIALAGDRRLEGRAEDGMLEPGEPDDKFLRLTGSALGEPGTEALFQRLLRLEDEPSSD
jgi:hypothetical protein